MSEHAGNSPLPQSSSENFSGNLHILDVLPQPLLSETPVFLAPGYAETTDIFDAAIAVIAGAGRRVLSMNHPRQSELRSVPDSFTISSPTRTYPKSGFNRALNIIKVIKLTGLGPVDAITHSMGSLDVTIAASQEPDLFRNIVFVNPAGLIGKDTFPRLAGRFASEAGGANLKQVLVASQYMLANPLRALAEGIGVSRAEMDDALSALYEAGKRMVIIAGVDDPLFPMERVQRTLQKKDSVRSRAPGTYIDGFVSVVGGHDDLHRQAQTYAKLAEAMLSALETRRA